MADAEDGANGARKQYHVSRNCLHCGKLVERTGRELRKYCSDECAKERKRLIRSGAIKRTCDWCGEDMTGSPSAKKFCSAECRDESDKAYRSERYQETIDERRAESREWMAKFKLENPEEYKARADTWYDKNRDKINSKRRTPERRAKANARMREYCTLRPDIRIHFSMSSSIWGALKSGKNGRSWESLVGYSREDLVRHLERQFLPGMSWNNYGHGRGKWHIDHILPRASFSISSPEDDDFKACWALTNLRPLWSEDNQAKGAKRLTLL